MPLAVALPHAEVFATDLAPSAVRLIAESAAARGVSNVTPQAVDAQDLGCFETCSFSVVTCSYGLMFMPDHLKALQEALRVLKPRGLYVATVFAPPEQYQFGWVSCTNRHYVALCYAVTAVLIMHTPVTIAQHSISSHAPAAACLNAPAPQKQEDQACTCNQDNGVMCCMN